MDGTSPIRPGAAADPERIAEHAIRALDQTLRAQFGVRARMGMELEYLMVLRDDAPALAARQTRHDPLQVGNSKNGQLFSHSRFLAACYREGGQSDAIASLGTQATRQYEVTSDFRHPMPLDRLPRAIAATRRELTGEVSAAAPRAHMHEGAGKARAAQRAWYADNVADIRFDTSPKNLITNGLHLNFSLVAEPTDTPTLIGRSDQVKGLVEHTRALFRAEKHLLTATHEQQLRWRAITPNHGPDIVIKAAQPANSVHAALNHVGATDECYIENKAPGADCNPHYAVLLQMAAIYAGMAGMKENPSLADILDTVEPGLGKRFTQAEAARPEYRSYYTQQAAAISTAR